MYAVEWEQFFYHLTREADEETRKWMVIQLYEWKRKNGKYGFEDES